MKSGGGCANATASNIATISHFIISRDQRFWSVLVR
jgi:hypothetical protein